LVEIRGFVNYFGGGKGIELVMKIVKEKEKMELLGTSFPHGAFVVQ
jgi:hypothetical protein